MKFLRLSRDASHVRRGVATVLRLPAREICFVTAAPAFIPAPQRFPIIPQNQVCGGKRRTYGFAAADLSGLSLPDAPCEHTDIRGKPKNLTRDFLPPIMDAVKSADRAYRDCPSRQVSTWGQAPQPRGDRPRNHVVNFRLHPRSIRYVVERHGCPAKTSTTAFAASA